VHFVGLFLSSLFKMHGPKNKIASIPYLQSALNFFPEKGMSGVSSARKAARS